MSHIFISYSKQDGEFMRYLRGLLEVNGMRVWVDEARLHAGARWWDEIETNIRACTALVVIMSPHAKQSDWVEREILLAENLGRPIYPVLLAGAPWSRLANIQYEDMRDGLHGMLSAEFLNRLFSVAGRRPLEFAITPGNVFYTGGDVLAFKYAQSFYGADGAAADRLIRANIKFGHADLKPGSHVIVPAPPDVNADHFLFIGMPNLRHFGYKHLRQMSMAILKSLQDEAVDVRHLVTTIHGPGFGLDEQEALRSQFGGFVDGVRAGLMPASLVRVTIVERDEKRAYRLQSTLADYLESEDYATRIDGDDWAYELVLQEDANAAKSTPEPADQRTHALVAMPDAAHMEDFFYYGVQGAVHAHGLLCERFTHTTLTAEQWAQIQARLDTAAMMIAEMTTYSPDVALQIGYALGRGCPVLLISQNAPPELFTDLPIITYTSIRDLETGIKAYLDALKAGLS